MAALNADLERDAERILTNHQLPCHHIVSVDRDSILYVNNCGKPRTCWLHVAHDGRVSVNMVPGFAAVEPAGWHSGIANFGRSGGDL